MLYGFSWIQITFPPKITFSSKRIWGETSDQIWMNGKYQDIQIWPMDKILRIQLTHIRPSQTFLLSVCVSDTYIFPGLWIIFFLLWSKAYWCSCRWYYQWDTFPPLILPISLPRKSLPQIPLGSFPLCLQVLLKCYLPCLPWPLSLKQHPTLSCWHSLSAFSLIFPVALILI